MARAFDPSDPGYAAQQFPGQCLSWQGGGVSRDSMHSLLSGIETSPMYASAADWHGWQRSLSDMAEVLRMAKSDLAAAWDSEAARQAGQRLAATKASIDNLAAAAGQIGDGFDQFGAAVSAAQQTKGASKEGVMDNVYNFLGGGDNDKAAEQTRDQFFGDINVALTALPTMLVTQLRGGGPASSFDVNKTPELGGVGSGLPPGLGGGGGAAPSGGSFGDTPVLKPPVLASPEPPRGPTLISDPGPPDWTSSSTSAWPTGDSGLPGGPASGGVHLDAGSSLAGYDVSLGSGGGYGGVGSGGSSGVGGGTGFGGSSGIGSGTGFGGSSGIGSGTGSGGAGSGFGSGASGIAGAGTAGGGSLAGAASGRVSAAEAGALARGGSGTAQSGMMGMGGGMGGAGRSGEQEREGATWLVEDDDVWGGSSAPPGVIG